MKCFTVEEGEQVKLQAYILHHAPACSLEQKLHNNAQLLLLPACAASSRTACYKGPGVHVGASAASSKLQK